MTNARRRWWAVLLAALGVLVAGCSATAAPPAPTVTVTQTVTAAPSPTSPGTPAATPSGSSRSSTSAAPSASRAASGLPTVPAAELPAEAQRTLALIAAGGPFPYSKDGSTFQNREGILPPQPFGYYREYTVDTPGSSDRGARRIVAGSGGVAFYTDDHYSSFREVIP